MLFLLVKFWCWLTFPRYLDHPDPCYWSSPGSLKLSPRESCNSASNNFCSLWSFCMSSCHEFWTKQGNWTFILWGNTNCSYFHKGNFMMALLGFHVQVPLKRPPRPLFLRRTSQSPLRTLERLPSAPVLASWVGAGLENVRPMYTIYLWILRM